MAVEELVMKASMREGRLILGSSHRLRKKTLNPLSYRYGEKMMGTLNNFASVVLEYPLSALKDSARPAYWVPDDECLECTVCRSKFEIASAANAGLSSSTSSTSSTTSPKIKLHHCRQCGQGVCGECSRGRKPVTLRGWDHPVRVCDTCINEDFSPIANWTFSEIHEEHHLNFLDDFHLC